ncbi:hypothetical protein [Streptomyces sp. B6B3]|uniref:hypothetical protein n=1 Tax=Streptomyces sp. B6B3 TaxID=3153570 RepID=UPI00325CB7FF
MRVYQFLPLMTLVSVDVPVGSPEKPAVATAGVAVRLRTIAATAEIVTREKETAERAAPACVVVVSAIGDV